MQKVVSNSRTSHPLGAFVVIQGTSVFTHARKEPHMPLAESSFPLFLKNGNRARGTYGMVYSKEA
jgi:hypothetical protein